jgi:GTP pyrophosphokinase
MDNVAENGIAAHWAYKEDKVYSKEKEQFEISQALKWYGDLLKFSQEDGVSNNAVEFVDTVKTDFLDANVYVYTPKGLIVELPKGSNPIDFAYRIHTDVGHKTVGAIVNNRIVTLDYELKTGDIVNIKTNKNSIGPSEDWLKIVKSQSARHKIKAFLNESNRDYLIEKGKQEFLDEISTYKVNEALTDETVSKVFAKNRIETIVDMYNEIGKGVLSAKTAANLLYGVALTQDNALQKQMDKVTRQLIANSDTGIFIEGITNPKVKLANCCNPIPGDNVVGFVSKTSGVVIHADFCKNIEGLDSRRLINVDWGSDVSRKYATWIKLICTNKTTLLGEIVNTINANNVMIAELQSVNSLLETVIKIKVSLQNRSQLDLLLINLEKIKEIHLAEREII